MRIVVLGAGQVATAVRLAAPEEHEILHRPRSQLDITDAAAVRRAVAELKPSWIVNAAAYTAVDLAEDQREQAISVNDTAVAVLAESAAESRARLLHISTDFVFDGRSPVAYLPADETNPLSVYGSSKLAGERHVLKHDSGMVLRTSWVYASSGRNFVLTMLRLMREKPRLSVVADQVGSPTWARSVACAVWGLITAQAVAGIYHWTDLGVASWYDFAVAIQDESLANGLLHREVPIAPISTSAYPTRATRPAFSVLDTASTRAAIGTPAYHWRHQLRAMLDELRTQ